MFKFTKILLAITLYLYCGNLYADPNNDQWRDTKKTYLDLINVGYEVKAYDISNFKDGQGNMYMFFVTVLQKENDVFECQEYQVFDDSLNTMDLSFVCRKLVQPYKKGLNT